MERKILVTKSQRYFTSGNPKTAKYCWIVLHGYGQLPQYFIRKFAGLNPETHFVVAPEGLHRFYLNGTSGRVGASWMTKEAREDDIQDNILFFNQLWEELDAEFEFDKRILLGFSQGGATAARWHEKGSFNADIFVFWASVFPPDLTKQTNFKSFKRSKNFFVLGNKDPYFENIALDASLQANFPIALETFIFEGVHDIDGDTLNRLASLVHHG